MDSLEEELKYLRKRNAELESLLDSVVRTGLKRQLKLNDLPTELQKKNEIIQDLIKAGSILWCDLPQELKDDAKIAIMYLKKDEMKPPGDRRAPFNDRSYHRVRGEPEPLSWRDLPHHLKLNKEVLDQALRGKWGPSWEDTPWQFHKDIDLHVTAILYDKQWLNDVPEDLFQNDERIALFGLQQKFIHAEESPNCLTPEVLRKAIEDNELDWESLPHSLLTDVGFAHSISKFSATCICEAMFNNVAELRGDLSFWNKLLNEFATFNHMTCLHDLLKRYATNNILTDHNFMAEACLADWLTLRLVEDQHLLAGANTQMFLDTLSKYPQAMMDVSHKVQLDHPELVHKAITDLGQKRGSSYAFNNWVGMVAPAIHPTFWDDNNDFIQIWLQAGLGIPHASEASHQSISAWLSDRALMLTHVLNCPDINFLPGRFEGDISFVLEVMDHKPEMYRAASDEARRSYHVTTVAYAAMPETAAEEILEVHFQGDDEEIQNYLDYLQEKLEPFRTFQSCILGNMLSTQSVGGTGTTLTLLNQGLETSRNYKKLLAEFLDIPTGKWLCQLQAAERNVRNAMAPWTTDRQPESVLEEQLPT